MIHIEEKNQTTRTTSEMAKDRVNKDIKIIVTIFHIFKNLQGLFHIVSGFLQDTKKDAKLTFRDENFNT